MPTAILEALTRFLASFMEWWQQKQLIQAGRNEIKLEDAEATIAIQERLNEIDAAPVAVDPQSILDRL